jgi:hypothetical protein
MSDTFNIVFMGTPAFAATVLQELAADKTGRYQVKLVLTRPPSISSRSLTPSPVQICAEELGIPVEAPQVLTEGSRGTEGVEGVEGSRGTGLERVRGTYNLTPSGVKLYVPLTRSVPLLPNV